MSANVPTDSLTPGTSDSIWCDMAYAYYNKWQEAVAEVERLSELLDQERYKNSYLTEARCDDGCYD